LGTRRFVLVTWDGGGNVAPFVVLGRRLVSRGHRVRTLATPALATRFEEAGVEFRARQGAPEFGRLRGDANTAWWEGLLAGPAAASHLAAELESDPADAAVVDCCLYSAFAAVEQAGLPTAALVHFLYQPHAEGDWAAGWDLLLPTLNATRDQFGLTPLDHAHEAWDRMARILVATPQELDFRLARVGPNVRYVGPILDNGPPRPWADPPWPPGAGEPLVLVSFSTNYYAHEAPLQRALDALADLPVRGLLTLGPALEPDWVTAPANVAVRRWVDHNAVLPLTSLVVTHAGHSTVTTALAAGVPLVCLPTTGEQPLTAERVEAVGAGRALDPAADTQTIRSAVQEVLGSPRFREGARRMSEAIGRLGRGQRAVEELEALAEIAG